MVGRGVEGGTASAAETRPVAEERVVAEASPAVAAATPAPSDYSYPQRLESDRPDEGLDRPARRDGHAGRDPAAQRRPGATRGHAGSRRCQADSGSRGRDAHAPAADAAPARGHPAGRPGRRLAAQALASLRRGLRDPGGRVQGPRERRHRRAEPEGPRPARLRRGPGGQAAGSSPCASGVYRDRADAEAVQERLRDDKFKPYVIKQ